MLEVSAKTNHPEPPYEAACADPKTRAPRAVLWLIAAFLGIIATCLVVRLDEPVVNRAFGQPVSHAGARGVFAFTGQVTKNTFGVFMVDVDAGTIWCYEWNEGRGCLRLLAARSWRYDRYLEEFNTCSPSPTEVERLVENQRAVRLQQTGAGQNEPLPSHAE
ncbi:MAG: hypothetical protein KAV82_02630 [Phycisphaerae bacterium]|nr:hypothetical protein [Phycisphaerae bacterium]